MSTSRSEGPASDGGGASVRMSNREGPAAAAGGRVAGPAKGDGWSAPDRRGVCVRVGGEVPAAEEAGVADGRSPKSCFMMSSGSCPLAAATADEGARLSRDWAVTTSAACSLPSPSTRSLPSAAGMRSRRAPRSDDESGRAKMLAYSHERCCSSTLMCDLYCPISASMRLRHAIATTHTHIHDYEHR